MERVDVYYDSHHYTVINDDIPGLEARVLDTAAGGAPFWLDVVVGEGTYRPARILITATCSAKLATRFAISHSVDGTQRK